MDRSIASLRAGSSTRNHSPDSERGSHILTDLESNLSALGHVGIVKHQRNALRQELDQQRTQTKQQKQAAASLRRLTLRLAVQISVKDARIASQAQALSRSRSTQYASSREKDAAIDQLQAGIEEYQRQARDLLKILENGNLASAEPVNKPHRILSRPISPPHSPFDTIPGPNKHVRKDSHPLPTEILEICQRRVQILLQDRDDQREKLEILRGSEAALRHVVHDLEHQNESLHGKIKKVEDELKDTNANLLTLQEKATFLQDTVRQLEQDKTATAENIAALESKIGGLETWLCEAEDSAALSEIEVGSLRADLEGRVRKLEKFERSVASLENNVQRQRVELEAAALDKTESEQQVARLQKRLTVLNQDHEAYQNTVTELRQAMSLHEQERQDAEWRLEASRTSRRETVDELTAARRDLHAATCAHGKTVEELEAGRDSLKTVAASEASLKLTIAQKDEEIQRQDSRYESKRKELKTAKLILTNFVQSTARLERQFSSEKRRSAALLKSKPVLDRKITQSADKINALENAIIGLEQQLDAARQSEASSEKTIIDLEAARDDAIRLLETTSAELREQLGNLSQSGAKAKGEITSYKTQLLEATNISSSLRSELDISQKKGSRLENDISTKANTIGRLEELVSQLREEIAVSKADVERLEKAKLILEKDFHSNKEELSGLRKSVDRANKRHFELESQFEEKRQLYQKAKQEVVSLESSNKAAILEAEKARVELDVAFKEKVQHASASSVTNAKVEELQRRIHTLESTIATKQATEHDTEERTRIAESQLVDVRRKLKDSHIVLAELQEKYDKTEDRTKHLEREHSLLSEELISARRELKATKEAGQTLKTQVTASHHEIGQLISERDTLQSQLHKFRSEAANFGQEKNALVEQVAAARKAAAAHSDARDALKRTLESLESDKSRLMKENRKTAAENSHLQERVRRNQTIVASHESALGAIRIRLGTSRMSKRNAEVKLNQAEKEFQALTRRHQKLEVKLVKTTAELSMAHERTPEVEKELHYLRREHGEAAEQLMQSERKVSTMQDTVHRVENEMKQFKGDFANFNAEIDAARTEILHLRDDVARLNKLQDEHLRLLSAKDAQIQELQTSKRMEVERLEASMAHLRESHEEHLERLTANHANMEELHKKKAEEVVRLERDVAQWKHSHEENIQGLQAKERRIQELQESNAREIERLQGEIAQITKSRDECVQTLKAKDAHLEESKQSNAQSYERLQIQVARLNEMHIANQEAIYHKEARIKQLDESKASLLLDQSRMKSTIQDLESDLETQRSSSAADHKAVETKVLVIEEMTQAKERVLQELEGLKSTMQQLQRDTEVLRKSNSERSEDVKRKKEKLKTLKENNTQLSEESSTLKSTVKKLHTDIQDLQKDRDADAEEVAIREREIKQLQNANSNLSEGAASLKATISGLETKLNSVRKVREDDSKNIRSKEQRIDDLSQANTQLLDDSSRLKSEMSQLENQIKTLNQQLAGLKDDQSSVATKSQNLGSELDTKDSTPNDYHLQIEKLQESTKSQLRKIGDLRLKLRKKDGEADNLRKANDLYAADVVPLRAEVNELRLAKESMIKAFRSLEHRNTELERSAKRDTRSLTASSPRPDTASTRVGTSDSMNAYYSPRPETADAKLKDGEPRKGMLRRWEDRNTRPRTSGHDSGKEAPHHYHNGSRMKARLQKMRHHEDTAKEPNPHEHGKVWNLVHYGSVKRPTFLPRPSYVSINSSPKLSRSNTTRPQASRATTTARPQTSRGETVVRANTMRPQSSRGVGTMARSQTSR